MCLNIVDQIFNCMGNYFLLGALIIYFLYKVIYI